MNKRVFHCVYDKIVVIRGLFPFFPVSWEWLFVSGQGYTVAGPPCFILVLLYDFAPRIYSGNQLAEETDANA
ncbi:hypothetical protein HEQ62_04635 [Haematospirillum jordaniae]|uniref:Uncharacterized protein n=1 Tax=Haematospirillum jordaniae TaxID=1549855 RepID=A0A143DDR0_9PROT|nr:hypothetical protein [Haematospirillum jordaniae]AMW34847.1 hypothetical protein AY555_06260 [Haematospirillum jordaniae]NKD45394.1 hypothetical protein [Haematospirillum jordaniae]NKD56778.1 hypothetical protein [Haematospirillum jordaniae]NKD59066.1 hypothetical protein [Haematospirillum jordaniae]NKD66702.1 hypothetical protein [Haematospirillum jordaniae]